MHQICGLQCTTQASVPFGCRFSRSKWKRTKVIQGPKAESSETKKAKLLARKKERISLSSYSDQFGVSYPIADFLNHRMGIESMLNTRALQRFEQLTPSTYRCYLQKIQLLNFEVAPILDLSVTPTSDACIVEMLSCKFEGSKILEEQNKHFSAFMRNHIRWNENCPEPFLDVDVEVTILLQVYTMPFVMLPISAVETPGNLIMQALVDRLVPLLFQQLIQDYQTWAEAQSRLPQKASSLSQYKNGG
ncbi:uncharacterized protein LOC116266946 [Nymphaea colorata]|nr:uncharacterized protein LOC116266946 [Nymphaea colorata]XP_031504328.1 uncharacterized protein LOC116266946 [Nymphaea colorata]XP_031504329.1 uncharacterized protein LOC116266946 [Nymphaea colorata]